MDNILLEKVEYYRKKAERNLYLLTSQSIYAEYLILAGEHDKALLVSLKGLLNSPWFFRLQIDLGLSYLLKDELNSAREEFKHALKIDPENPLAHFFLALTYIKMDRLREAEAVLESGFDYNPDDKYIKDLLEKIYHIQGKNVDSMSSDFIEIKKKAEEGFISSSNLLKIKEKKDKIPYEVLYAISLVHEDNLSKAISILDKILIYNPYYPKALYNLGKIYSIIGDEKKRDENWKKAFEINPLLPELKKKRNKIESIHIDVSDLSEMENLKNLIIEYTLKKCREFEELTKKEELIKDKTTEEEHVEIIESKEENIEISEVKEEKPEIIETSQEKEIKERPEPVKEVLQQEEKGEIEDYKRKGMEYLKKKMFKEAIEMFTKALKEGREKI